MEDKNQVQQKLKSNGIFILVFAIITVVSGALGFVLNDVFGIDIAGDILAGVFAISAIALIVGIRSRIKLKRAFCSNCQERIYMNDVEVNVLSVETGYNLFDSIINKLFETVQGDYNAYAKVSFTITCRECGTVKTFTKKIKIGRVTESGRVEEYSVEEKIKEFLTKYLSLDSID
ncbi:MAG: hypothetical protein IJD42_02195 [Clostridia bacterium]|nr:hypothetical protein [Clostridia bacterium]